MRRKAVIIGGGFAGLQACKTLAKSDITVTLIDPSPVTTLQPALPDLAGGWIPEWLVRRGFDSLLPSGVIRVQKKVERIDLDSQTVMADGESIFYDYLVIASGSVPQFYGLEAAREHLYPLASLPDALRIRHDFPEYVIRSAHPHLVVAGGGYTGLELAMSLFHRARETGKSCRLTIVDPGPQLLPFLETGQRRQVMAALAAISAEIRTGTQVEKFDGHHAVAGGLEYKDIFLCWAAGTTFAVPEIQGNVERLRDGRLKVQRDLSLPNYPHVFAAGDAAAFEYCGQVLRKAVNFAFHGGRRAARNIIRRHYGRRTRPFRPVDLGWVIPLHTTSVAHLPFGLRIQGRLGLHLHHLMCGLRNYSFNGFAGCLKLAWKGKYT